MTSKEIDNAYVGYDQVDAIYLGSDKIYPNYVHMLSASTYDIQGEEGDVFQVDILASDPWTASYDGMPWNLVTFSPASGTAGTTTMTVTYNVTVSQAGGAITVTDSTGAYINIQVSGLPL